MPPNLDRLLSYLDPSIKTFDDEPEPEDPRAVRPLPAVRPHELPYLLSPEQAAAVLGSSVGAVYARAQRGQLPGALRTGRRLQVHRDRLLASLDRAAEASTRRKP